MRGDMKALVERGVTINTPTGQPAPIAPITFPPAPVPTPPPGGPGSTNAGGVAGPAVPAGPAAAGARPVAVNQPGVFPSQRGVGAGRTSNGAGAAGSAYPAAPVPTSGGLNSGPNPALNPVANPAMGYSPGGLVKVSATGIGGTDGAASTASASGGQTVNSGTGAVPASGAPAKPLRTVANFLPVGFTRAVLLGGLAMMVLLLLFGGALVSGLLAPLSWTDIFAAFVILLVVRPLTGLVALLGLKASWTETHECSKSGRFS